MKNLDVRWIFTLTAGRTGTAWLAHFLGLNLKCAAIHEPLGIDDFGVRMPDIKLMRTFNERGNNAAVRAFWARKLSEIEAVPLYVETNHTLGKCGLVENLADSSLATGSVVVVLRRDLRKQAKSYIARADFRNITIDWQWYLSPRYPNVIINPDPFLPMGPVGRAIWYTFEMDLRQRYYERLYAGQVRFVSVSLEEVVREAGARRFLGQLGFPEAQGRLPPPSNTGDALDHATATAMDGIFERLVYEPDTILDNYLRRGKRLGGW